MSRPKSAGRVYYLGRVRYVPGLHSLELGDWLELFTAAGQAEKLRMLDSLIKGGGFSRNSPVTSGEEAETTEFLDDLLSDL